MTSKNNKQEEKEVLCNMCGHSCVLYVEDTGRNHIGGMIDQIVHGGFFSTAGNGYGALDDMSFYKFSLCEFCLDWMFSNFKIPVREYCDAFDEEIEFKPAKQRIEEAKSGRNYPHDFFPAYEKRNKDRGVPLSLAEKNIKDLVE